MLCEKARSVSCLLFLGKAPEPYTHTLGSFLSGQPNGPQDVRRFRYA